MLCDDDVNASIASATESARVDAAIVGIEALLLALMAIRVLEGPV